MNIHENIKKKRKEKDLTLEQLAKKLNTSRQTIARYESGEISHIPYDKVVALADALKCTPGELMGWEEQAEPSIENADALASLMKDATLLDYVKKVENLDMPKRLALYQYIDFLVGH